MTFAEAGALGVGPGHRSVGIEVVGVSKAFGAIRALNDVNLSINPGTVHGLVGENGAGKSTLGRIIAGVIEPDSGHLKVNGRAVRLRSPRDALVAGIAAIEQEIALVPNLSVQDNVLLGVEPRRAGWIRRRALEERWRALLEDSGFRLNGTDRAGSLPIGARQQVEILRALSRRADVIIMDEPTAALNESEAKAFYDIVRTLARRGSAVVIVTHFLKEVIALADTVSVLRDGRLVSSGPVADQTEASLIRAMLGRDLSGIYPKPPAVDRSSPPALTVRHLTAPGLHGVSLDVHPGEIVGLAGLEGSGRRELGRAIYGDLLVEFGMVKIGAQPLRRHHPRNALALGLAMIPASRREDGLFLIRPVVENSTISSLFRFSRAGIVQRRIERAAARETLIQLGVGSGRESAAVSTLSGGNQQKVLLARTLLRGAVVLVACEPTRGVDVGAKSSIYKLLNGLAQDGMGLLLDSSEPAELIGLCHRVLVLRRGHISQELVGEQITEEAILTASLTDTD